MSELVTIKKLLACLGNEISQATSGSSETQFPILDLLGTIRDEGLKTPQLRELGNCAAEAWGTMVGIVERGQAFDGEQVKWLQELEKSLSRFACAEKEVNNTSGADIVSNGNKQVDVSMDGQLDENSLVLNIAEDVELLREFLNESREHLDNIEQGILVLESRPTDAETLSTIFRAFHTFKGSAGFLNLLPINRLAHVLETLLDLVRQHKLSINQEVTELILRGRDLLKQFLDAIQAQLSGVGAGNAIKIETAPLKLELEKVIHSACEKPGAKAVSNPEEKGAPVGSSQLPPAPADPCILPGTAATPQTDGTTLERSVAQNSVVRVDTAKLDSLLDLIGEMVISQSLVSQNLNRLAEQDPQFARNIAQLSRTTRELQRVGMSMRMVPIRGVFQKMSRVVRDLGAKQNKKVQLATTGEDTELDRGVVEELNDPLLHMIRNSVDHGIEPEAVRLKSSKPATGTIHLKAFHQGGSIVIEIEDDGAGLNREKIWAKAVQRGLTNPTAKLTDEEVFGFIFAAGFSTAEKVTDISGRGVGLDVVRRNIERLRGCVDISSSQGKGTRFKITLPLTLAIIDGLVVKVGQERYVIPTLSVRESFRPRKDMITRVRNRAEVVNVRGRLIPLLRLYEYFGIQPLSTDPSTGIIVVAQSGANFRCLLVDSLESKQEVVIKNLNELLVHKNHSLAGAAILGDGRVGLILDVNALVQQQPQSFANAA